MRICSPGRCPKADRLDQDRSMAHGGVCRFETIREHKHWPVDVENHHGRAGPPFQPRSCGGARLVEAMDW